MSIEMLLSEISHISKKYEILNQKTGGYFNIFNIVNIESDEVCICRFIHELINPKGSHYQGYTYLKMFVEEVLNMKFNDYDYKKAVVKREYVICNERRVDLVIEIADKVIPIEVKIYAKDQENQCYDYYKYCAKNSNVFYLTLRGGCPSKESANNLTHIYENSNIIGYKEVSQISFDNEILSWLSKCVSHHETIKIAPIREVILQFMGVIRSMTNLLLEDKENEIISILSASSDNIKSAIDIEKSLKACKVNMMKKVLETIEERLDNSFKDLSKIDIYSYKSNNYNLVNKYYDKKGSTCPGLSYFIKNLNKEDVDLILRFEINNSLFVGFCTSYKKEYNGKLLDQNEINDLLCEHEPCAKGWWIYWEYLPNNKQALAPNFKEFNEAYFDLFDENKFNRFIDLCEEKILNILNMLK